MAGGITNWQVWRTYHAIYYDKQKMLSHHEISHDHLENSLGETMRPQRGRGGLAASSLTTDKGSYNLTMKFSHGHHNNSQGETMRSHRGVTHVCK